jgi:hypothetical protein
MKSVRRIVASLLNFTALTTLLLGSCAGPLYVYNESPRWLLQKIDGGVPWNFFVAERTGDEGGPGFRIVRYEAGEMGGAAPQYRLPDGHHSAQLDNESYGTVDAVTEAGGSQLVLVFVSGDSIWSSMSEYRVENNRVLPLRHSQAAGWLLLGAPLLLIVVGLLWNPIRRGTRRLLRVEPN